MKPTWQPNPWPTYFSNIYESLISVWVYEGASSVQNDESLAQSIVSGVNRVYHPLHHSVAKIIIHISSSQPLLQYNYSENKIAFQ